MGGASLLLLVQIGQVNQVHDLIEAQPTIRRHQGRAVEGLLHVGGRGRLR